MKITAQVPANLSWHQCIGCLEKMAREMDKDDTERLSVHDAERLGALANFVFMTTQTRDAKALAANKA